MPIYAYKCSTCGHAADALQKMSAAPLTLCPACGAETYSKQVTAAGFALKGSGWYVTDFRSGGAAKPAEGAAVPGAEAKTDTKADAAPAATPESTSSTPAATPAPAAPPAVAKPAATAS